MHALGIVQQWLRSCCPQIHATRLSAIIVAVNAAILGRRLTLTELGRSLTGAAHVKHNIKRIDRLLANRHLAAESMALYRAHARRIVGKVAEPVIIVDWSDLTADRRWQLLRAALPVGGRALTLYEEVHPLRHFANPRVHRLFLARLKALLPENACPVLITDAGFRGPWFKAVRRIGWHWIGRIRNRDFVRPAGTEAWYGCKTLYTQASARPRSLGLFEVVRSNPFVCRLYLVKRPKRHRIHSSIFGLRVHSNRSLKQASAQREPWLLATSCSLASRTPSQIVNLYATRMQIEESFRDLKCARYGLGFEFNLSRSRERIAALLLIALLALFVLWLIGQRALSSSLQFQFQSNTRRTRPVLSCFNLAIQLVRHTCNQLLSHDLRPLRLPIYPPRTIYEL